MGLMGPWAGIGGALDPIERDSQTDPHTERPGRLAIPQNKPGSGASPAHGFPGKTTGFETDILRRTLHN